ncbi:hypothetical protein AB9K41_00535, partial [Cribrihabitans sp. XS_ASV171]
WVLSGLCVSMSIRVPEKPFEQTRMATGVWQAAEQTADAKFLITWTKVTQLRADRRTLDLLRMVLIFIQDHRSRRTSRCNAASSLPQSP